MIRVSMVCIGLSKESLVGVKNLWGGMGWDKLGRLVDRGLEC